MKKHLTKVAIGKKEFILSQNDAQAILSLAESLDRTNRYQDGVPAEVVFKQIAKDRPKGAIYLRGIRNRENMSQKELEKKSGIPLSNISKYENGTRKITESVAKKFAKIFKAEYHQFIGN